MYAVNTYTEKLSYIAKEIFVKVLTKKFVCATICTIKFALIRGRLNADTRYCGGETTVKKVRRGEKQMDELKDIFGEDSLDYATFEQKVKEKGWDLKDFSGGKYVSKEKYSRLQGDFDKYKADNDPQKYADYDAIKAERDQLLQEKEDAQLAGQVSAANVSEKYAKFVTAEVKALVTNGKTFAECLADYLKENPQFVEQAQKPQSFFSRGNSSLDVSGVGVGTPKTTDRIMNDFIRRK